MARASLLGYAYMYALKKCLERIKSKSDWYNKSYSGYVFGIAQQGVAIAQSGKVSLYANPYVFIFQNHVRPEHCDGFFDSELLAQKRKKLLNVAKKDSRFPAQFYGVWEKQWNAYMSEWRLLATVDFTAVAPDVIRNRFATLHKKYVKQAQYAYVVDVFLNDSKEDWLEEMLKVELGTRATPAIIATLTAPTFPSFVSEFEVKKLLIVLHNIWGRDKEKILKECEVLVREYFWIRTNYLSYSRLDLMTVYKEVVAESKLGEAEIAEKIKNERSRVPRNKRQKAALIKKLKISRDTQSILKTSELFTLIQDKRKEGALRNNVVFYSGLAAMAKKCDISDDLIFYLTPLEFLDEGKFNAIDWKEIKERKEKGALFVFCGDEETIIPRAQYEKEFPVDTFFPQHSGTTEIKGAVAYKGLVRGIARIVRSIADIEKFKAGEVLIANQTTPEFVPAMKKAIAIVTDQGGITCHAAIIAREMQKPCIIGTKNATKILKDSDRVEVDADAGVVKKIA